jgi:membrane associated rhomboid family serine protease
MLSDRSYMRGGYEQPERPSVLVWLMGSIGAGFILQFILGSRFFGGGQLVDAMELSVPNLERGWVWSLVTYSFLHSRNLLHLLFNLLGLYFFGREVLPRVGPGRFLGIYFAAVAFGGLFWAAIHWRSGGGQVIGASAGVLAMLSVFACFNPNQRMTFLLFFIFPVTLKPKHLALGVAGFEMLGLLLYEMGGGPSQIAHSAHLAGMGAGWLYVRYVHDAEWRLKLPKRATRTVDRVAERAASVAASVAPQADRSSAVDLRSEVDRILDKINSKGFGALTEDEKRLLDDAKDILSRR